ncbi:MAG: hypothetical protein MUO99_00635 [Dehalococcoidales bacterium]|nr:hypothetical protein [Dehalococcoidales bacterium]
MTLPNVHRFLKLDYLMLPPILALAFYLAFIPHSNYPYPVHLDEWAQLASSNEIIKQASVVGLADPFSGGEPTINQLFEVGSHLFWAIFHQISGIPWLDIFKYFPSIIFVITVLSVYVLAQRQGFGWEAALFTCLIPTTVGILGPGFLVPAALGLPFIPLSLFLVFNFKTWWSYLAVFIFICFLFTMHAVIALALVIILIPSILLNLRGNFRHSLSVTLTIAIPFLVAFLWAASITLPMAKSLLSPTPLIPYVDIPRIVSTYGYFPVSLTLLGTLLLAIRGSKNNYGLILGLLALLLMLLTFYTFHYGLAIMYYRGLTPMMLMISIVAGAGLMEVRKLRLPAKLTAWIKAPFIAQNVGNILCLVLIVFTLAIAIPARQNIPYYHMIDEEDYETFVWIKDNVDSSYERAILDPWKGTAFTAITGKYRYTAIGEAPTAKDNEAQAFLNGGCKDTAFLRENNISIVYTREKVDNPDLVDVREYVYLLKDVQSGK